jgi:hypothetical protein
MTTGSEPAAVAFTSWRWIFAWLGFAVAHLVCMAVDWQLRDPTQNAHPMAGGIPDGLLTTFQWGSLAFLLVALFLWMPRTWAIWVRALLAIVQAGLALMLMVVGWLYYVLSNGIDTL